jgi:predicted transcriptional regulator
MIDVPTPNDLRTERKEANLSQSELADRVGISQPALSQIESGNNDPTLSTVRRIALEINKAQA